jgi:hypothetical protein
MPSSRERTVRIRRNSHCRILCCHNKSEGLPQVFGWGDIPYSLGKRRKNRIGGVLAKARALPFSLRAASVRIFLFRPNKKERTKK